MKRAVFRFYEELNDFLPPEQKRRDSDYSFLVSPSVKDAIEAQGVPHTEVDLVLANGVSVDFSYRLRDGDRIAVYPVFEALDIGPVTRLRAAPLREVRFILDVHLGKLARYLRICGFDTLYRNDYADPEIVRLSLSEHRAILTRDIGILRTGSVTHGYWIRSQHIEEQLREVLWRFDLKDRVRLFTRCAVCNGALEDVPKREVEESLPPLVRLVYDEFRRCSGCGRVYWRGSHADRVEALVERALRPK